MDKAGQPADVKKMRCAALLSLALVSLCIMPMAGSTGTPFMVFGFVRDENGAPLENATVTAFDSEGNRLGQANTSDQGFYSIMTASSMDEGERIAVRAVFLSASSKKDIVFTTAAPGTWANLTLWRGANVDMQCALSRQQVEPGGAVVLTANISSTGLLNVTGAFFNVSSCFVGGNASLQQNASAHNTTVLGNMTTGTWQVITMEVGVPHEAVLGSTLSINVTLEAQGETGPIGPRWWNATVAVEAAGHANDTAEPGSMPIAAAVAAAGMVIITILFILVCIGRRRRGAEEQ